MRPLERIQEDLDKVIEEAEEFVTHVKAQAHRRPWVFTSGGLLLGLVGGIVLVGALQ